MKSVLALQKHVAEQLKASPEVTALVPAESIADRHELPTRFPCVMLGEAFVDYADHDQSFFDVALLQLHVWAQGADTVAAKQIVSAIHDALPAGVWSIEGLRYARGHVVDSRFRRESNATQAIVNVRVVLK